MAHPFHEHFALTGDDFGHGALGDLVVQRIAKTAGDAVGGDHFAATDGTDERLGLDDPPLDEGVDLDVELFGGDEPVDVRVVDGQDALVEVLDVLERRGQLEVKPRLVDDLTDLTQGEDNRELALIDHEDAGRQHCEGDQRRQHKRNDTLHGDKPLAAGVAIARTQTFAGAVDIAGRLQRSRRCRCCGWRSRSRCHAVARTRALQQPVERQ